MTQLPSEVVDKTPEEIEQVQLWGDPDDSCARYRYDPRENLWCDVVRMGLAKLVAVDEVLHAARLVLREYDREFGLGFVEPEVPEGFYDHDPNAATTF